MITAYKVEELLALRATASESAMSLDRFGDEDAIREHVLRPSASAQPVITRTESPRQPPSPPPPPPQPRVAVPVAHSVAIINHNKRPSPSPSVKRSKVERLIKEHGSPPGMKVTCGGRVVPTDLMPLGNNPRLSSIPSTRPQSALRNISPAIPPATPLLGPIPGFPPSLQAPNGYLAYDTYGRICQVVNGQIIPLQAADGGVQTYVTPPSLSPAFAPGLNVGNQQLQSIVPLPMVSPLAPVNIPQPPNILDFLRLAQDENLEASSKIHILESEYGYIEQQLKDLERSEVVQAEYLGPVWRSEAVQIKRTFVTVLDQIRKLIKGLKEEPRNVAMLAKSMAPMSLQRNLAGDSRPTTNNPVSAQPLSVDLKAYLRTPTDDKFPFSQPYDAPIINHVVSNNPMDRGIVVNPEQAPASSANGTNSKQAQPSPWRAQGARRSHAIEIKDPRESGDKAKTKSSTLNPASPTYVPGRKINQDVESSHVFVPPTPSPIPSPDPHETIEAQHPWLFSQKKALESTPLSTSGVGSEPLLKSSVSSISTADFFPVNTHEYSSNRYLPSEPIDMQGGGAMRESAPHTPQKTSSYSEVSPMSNENQNPVLQQRATEIRRVSSSWTKDFSAMDDSSENLLTVLAVQDHVPSERSFSQTTTVNKPAFSTSAPTGMSHIGSVHISKNPETSGPLRTAYQHGFSAGLQREAIGNETDPEYVLGYCDGLKQSNSLSNSNTRSDKPISVNHSGPVTHEPISKTSASSIAERATAYKETSDALRRRMLPNAGNSHAFNPDASAWVASQASRNAFRNVSNAGTSFHTIRVADQTQATGDAAQAEKRSSTANHHQILNWANQQAFNANQGISAASPSTFNPVAFPSFAGLSLGTNKGTPLSVQRHFPTSKSSTTSATIPAFYTSRRDSTRVSQCDGTMEDLAELGESPAPSPHTPPSTMVRAPPSPGENTYGCGFSGSPSKGAGKSPESPSHGTPKSPKSQKSPAKQKLEQLFSKAKAKDPATMSKAKKDKWDKSWRDRFVQIKGNEEKMVQQYRKDHPVK